MKCDHCDEEATVFLTQIAGGEMKKIRLCEACAKERGVTSPEDFSLDDFMQKGFEGQNEEVKESFKQPTFDSDAKCPECGFSIDQFEKVRRFGCATCYEVFSEELQLMLQGMHKGAQHLGKIPENQAKHQMRSQQLAELQEKLKQAIDSESYEEAATVRDEIQAMQEEPKK